MNAARGLSVDCSNRPEDQPEQQFHSDEDLRPEIESVLASTAAICSSEFMIVPDLHQRKRADLFMDIGRVPIPAISCCRLGDSDRQMNRKGTYQLVVTVTERAGASSTATLQPLDTPGALLGHAFAQEVGHLLSGPTHPQSREGVWELPEPVPGLPVTSRLNLPQESRQRTFWHSQIRAA